MVRRSVSVQSGTPAVLPQIWAELLKRTLEREILPQLLSRWRPGAVPGPDFAGAAAVAAFVDLIIADDMEQVRAIADQVIVQAGSRKVLLEALLMPAARLLGVMWEQDRADFVTVTLGVYQLDRIMKETEMASTMDKFDDVHERRILLLPAPGEQHSFGLGMVADAFRADGWSVRSGAVASRAQLLALARDEWFDVIGLSVSSERWLKGLAGCIRTLRSASSNKQALLLAGGPAIVNQPERSRFLGVDAIAADAREALALANIFMETTVTAGLHQSNSGHIEFG